MLHSKIRWGAESYLLILVIWLATGCNSPSMPGGTQPGSTPPPGSGSASIIVNSVTPDSVPTGSPDVQVTLTGDKLPLPEPGVYHVMVVWFKSPNDAGTSLTLMAEDSSAITAIVPAALLTEPRTTQLQVQLWHKADDVPKAVSAKLNFKITQ